MHSLILNHGFVDGNKRTAVFMLATLLTGSGYSLWFPTASLLNADVEEMVVAVAEHRMGLDEIATWIKTRLVKLPP